MSIKGIFRILLFKNTNYSEQPRVCGTAFAIAHDNINDNHYYLLTSFHVISETISKEQKIFLQNLDYGNELFIANPVWLPSSTNNYEFGIDFALLDIYVEPNIKFDIFPLKLYENINDSSLNILGASIYAPSGRYPEFYKISVCSHYLTNIIHGIFKEENKSLVMTLNFSGNVFTSDYDLKKNTHIISPQEMFGGISGSPILTLDDNVEKCIGLVSNIEADSIASRLYGVVSNTILTKCINIHNLLKSICIEKQSSGKTSSNGLCGQFDFLIDSIIENPFDFVLDDPNTENIIWDKISNYFYKGHPVDTIINFGVNSEHFNLYSIDTQLVLRYFLARLYFKRGKSSAAYKQFNMIRNNERKMSRIVWHRITVLMESRSLIENPIYIPNKSLDRMLKVEEQLSKLNTVNDVYKANELASTLGRGLTNIFIQEHDFSIVERRQILEIFKKHTDLLAKYPYELRKQDVVNTSINWLINTWGITSSPDLDQLFTDVKNGLCQAEIRRNSIFHIQSLLAFCIHKFLSRNYYDGVIILFLVIQLMKQEQLDINHEGISQLLTFLKTHFLNYYGIFIITFYHNNNDQELFDKLNLYKDNLSERNIINARSLSQHIKTSLYDNVNKLYTVKFNSIMNILK